MLVVKVCFTPCFIQALADKLSCRTAKTRSTTFFPILPQLESTIRLYTLPTQLSRSATISPSQPPIWSINDFIPSQFYRKFTDCRERNRSSAIHTATFTTSSSAAEGKIRGDCGSGHVDAAIENTTTCKGSWIQSWIRSDECTASRREEAFRSRKRTKIARFIVMDSETL